MRKRRLSASELAMPRVHAIAGVAILVTLSACASTSEVVRAGPGLFIVSSGGGMYEQNPSGIRQRAYQTANSYCDKLGKQMEPVQVNERQYELGHHTASIELTFKCQ